MLGPEIYVLLEGGFLSLRFRNAKYLLCALIANAAVLPFWVIATVLPMELELFGNALTMLLPYLIAGFLLAVMAKAAVYRAMLGWGIWKSALFAFCGHTLATVLLLCVPFLADYVQENMPGLRRILDVLRRVLWIISPR